MVAFAAVIVGWALSLDYSAKLFTMTFVLVIMGSEKASGESMLAWHMYPSMQQHTYHQAAAAILSLDHTSHRSDKAEIAPQI